MRYYTVCKNLLGRTNVFLRYTTGKYPLGRTAVLMRYVTGKNPSGWTTVLLRWCMPQGRICWIELHYSCSIPEARIRLIEPKCSWGMPQVKIRLWTTVLMRYNNVSKNPNGITSVLIRYTIGKNLLDTVKDQFSRKWKLIFGKIQKKFHISPSSTPELVYNMHNIGKNSLAEPQYVQYNVTQ